jgi:hypothetical protein
MLGFVAKFGSSKGMVRVPNILGLSAERASGQTLSPAIEALVNSGLNFSVSTAEDTTVFANDKKVKSQNPPVDTLVDYESGISFTYNSYIVISSYGQPENYKTVESYDCSGTTKIPKTTTYRRRAVYSNNSFVFWEELGSSTATGQSQTQSKDCDWVAPPCTRPKETCGDPTAWSGCRNIGAGGGAREATVTCIRTDCTSYTKTVYKCCMSPQCTAWSAWTGTASSGGSRTRTCYDADCNATEEKEKRCASPNCGSWRNVGACKNGKRARERTCVNTDCSTYIDSGTVTCQGSL